MSVTQIWNRFSLTCLVSALLLPVGLFSQDTIRVKLPESNVFEDGSLVSDLSKLAINRLVRTSDYLVLPVQSNSDPVDLMGLCEIDSKSTPEGFAKSAAVFTSSNVIITTTDKTVKSFAELADVRVGVLASSVAEDRIRRETQFVETYATTSRLVQDLMKGRIDYVLVEASLAKAILNHDGMMGKLSVANGGVFETKLGFLVRKDNAKLLAYLDQQIGTFRDSKEEQALANRFIDMPKDFGSMILLWSLICGAAAIVTLVLLGWRRGWIRRLVNLYSVQLKGLLMIRPSPTMRTGAPEDQANPGFKEKFSVFQMKYPSIDSLLEFQNSAVKIEFRTTKKTHVEGKAFLDRFARDLEDLISPFAAERYVMELNVTGECSNMFELNKFVMTNNRGRVGVMVSEFKKKLFI